MLQNWEVQMKKILIIDQLDQETIVTLQPGFKSIIDYKPETSSASIAKELCDNGYDALIVRNKFITQDMIVAWANSKPHNKLCIVRAGSNLSTIDVKTASSYDISVMNTPGANSPAVAQYVIMQLLYLSSPNQTMLACDDIKRGLQRDKSIYANHTLAGDVLALIGTGAIGAIISKIATALGMKVQAYSPNLTASHADSIGATYCSSIEEAFTGANFISVQVPYTLPPHDHPTQFIIDKKLLDLAQYGAKLVNISRRDVLNMVDLNEALQTQQIANVSLDLLYSEIEEIRRDFPHVLQSEHNVVTPLIGCESHKAHVAITRQALLKAEDFFANLNQ